MRTPFIPEALENTNEPVSRDPSYPDRARIDSDVRAFLRPVSTPWIVFDRDSRVDDFAKSALRLGAVFASTPSFRQSLINGLESVASEPAKAEAHPAPSEQPAPLALEANMFPPPSPESVAEPSNLVVAADVIFDSEPAIRTTDDGARASGAFVTNARPKRRSGRLATIAAAGVGLLALVATSAVVVKGRGPARTAAATQALVTPAPPPAVPAVEVPPSQETLEVAPTPLPATTTTEPRAASQPAASTIPTDPKKRFGRLTIKADAKYKNVYLDGKRMLGTGQRSFNVFCGIHTIAVADKADAKDVEIPCNGEYVVAK